MLKISKILLLVTLCSTALLSACDKDAKEGPKPAVSGGAADGSAVVATVNGTPITRAVFDSYAAQRNASQPEANLDPKATLDDLINREIVYQDGLSKEVDKKPETLANLENQRRNIVATAAVAQYVKANEPTEEILQKEYQNQVSKLSPKEFKARHILVKDEAVARDIFDELNKGGDFAGLATANSVDQVSAKNGGDLGWFNPGQMVKPFADAIVKLQKGKYGVPVKSEFGWHIILLEDTRPAPPKPEFAKAKENIRGIVMNDQLKNYLEKLKSTAKIEIKDPNFLAASPAGLSATTMSTAPAVPAPAPTVK